MKKKRQIPETTPCVLSRDIRANLNNRAFCVHRIIIVQVFYYSTSIFKDAGMSTAGAQYGNLGAGLINFVVTILSSTFIDNFGRKTLLLFSSAVCVCMLTALMVSMIISSMVRIGFKYPVAQYARMLFDVL